MKIANVHLEKINNPQNHRINRQNLNFQMNYLNLNHFDSFEKAFKNNEKRIKNSLKDENLLYEIFSGKDVDFPTEILNDQDFMQEMFYDVDYMKASNKAFKRIVEDKLKDETMPLESEDRTELAFLHSLFSSQEKLFNDPRNSFETGLGDLKIEAKNKRYFNLFNQMPEPAFCSVFNYGFMNKPKTRKQKAEAIVNRAASAAAAEAALVPKYFKSPKAEVAALSATTRLMCKEICKTYQMPGELTTKYISLLTGKVAGEALLKYISKYFPFGRAINASVTYTLHQLQGRAIIEWCEKNYNNPDIKYADLLIGGARQLNALSSIGPNPVDVLGDLNL